MNTVNTEIGYETIKHPTDRHKYIVLNHNTEEAQEVLLVGHWVYLRMTERAEDLGGIYLPEKSRDEHNTLYEVIAIGYEHKKFRPRQQKFKGVQDMDRNAITTFDVGDTVIIPEKATADGHGYQSFVKRSPVSQYEGVVDKGLILAKV